MMTSAPRHVARLATAALRGPPAQRQAADEPRRSHTSEPTGAMPATARCELRVPRPPYPAGSALASERREPGADQELSTRPDDDGHRTTGHEGRAR
jgi:hypothetical protein